MEILQGRTAVKMSDGAIYTGEEIKAEMLRALDLFSCGRLFEIRTTSGKSGYFKNPSDAVKEIAAGKYFTDTWYITLNNPKESCWGRKQSGQILAANYKQKLSCTGDTDVDTVRHILIDLDPQRESDTNSTASEKQAAFDLAPIVIDDLMKHGFPEPVKADSGNGIHILFPVCFGTDGNSEKNGTIWRFLQAVKTKFSNDLVEVDTSVFNPSRICKLYGSLITNKGADIPERPYRMSRILSIPENWREELVTPSMLTSYTEEILGTDGSTKPMEKGKDIKPNPSKKEGTQDEAIAHVEAVLKKIGIAYQYKGMTDYDGGTAEFDLDECLFEPGYRNGNAKVFVYSKGSKSYVCHHNTNGGRCEHSWEDVEELAEPGYKQRKAAAFKSTWPPEQASTDWKAIIAKSAAEVNFNQTPQPTMFIDGILTEGVYLLNAFSKVGKSRLLLQMLLSMASGRPFLERPVVQCGCLYLALEDERMDYENRLHKFCDLWKQAPPEHLYTLTKEDFPNYITPVIGGGLAEVVEAHLNQYPEIRVVGIDVFSIIRSKSESRDFSRDERRDLDALLRLCAKHQISIILAHHTGKNGLTGTKFRGTATGSGAGSYAVSGTVIGEMEIVLEPGEDGRAIFRAGGRRTKMCELSVYANYPAWEFEGNAAEIREKNRQAKAAAAMSMIVATAEYLVDRDGEWTGRMKNIMEESDNVPNLPPFYERISTEDMESQELANKLKQRGISYRINSKGTGGCTFTFKQIKEYRPVQSELPL